MKTFGNRMVTAAAAAAIALTSVALTPASAAPVNKKPTASAAGDTDFSSRRRHRGNRAAIGAFLGVAGTIAALAARDRYYYDGYYAYGGGPYYRPYYAPYAYGPYPYGRPVLRPNPWGGSYGYFAPY
jgi:hypothetical protein